MPSLTNIPKVDESNIAVSFFVGADTKGIGALTKFLFANGKTSTLFCPEAILRHMIDGFDQAERHFKSAQNSSYTDRSKRRYVRKIFIQKQPDIVEEDWNEPVYVRAAVMHITDNCIVYSLGLDSGRTVTIGIIAPLVRELRKYIDEVLSYAQSVHADAPTTQQ